MMLEADIVMGTTNETTNVVPIMAHPPSNHSDLTLESFLRQVYEKKVHKGIKLDFKSTEAFNKSVDILKKMDDKVNVWHTNKKIYHQVLRDFYLRLQYLIHPNYLTYIL